MSMKPKKREPDDNPSFHGRIRRSPTSTNLSKLCTKEEENDVYACMMMSPGYMSLLDIRRCNRMGIDPAYVLDVYGSLSEYLKEMGRNALVFGPHVSDALNEAEYLSWKTGDKHDVYAIPTDGDEEPTIQALPINQKI